ncbi:MAG: hypothetical protein IPN86_05255 [Saprospiraceae bacterium]|nr:hypothetical protein [Saprospiraceae bacterium]
MYRNLIYCFIIFLFSNILNGQDTLFFEDFNDCALSSKWSYELTGFQNVAWGVGLPPNSKAEGSSINGTCLLYIDDDLTGDKTPPFKLRIFSTYFNGKEYTDITFKAQAHFRRDKTEFMKIIIDDGKKEHVIREFKGRNYSGDKFSNFVDISSDLSFIASDSMRIIIEYDDDNQWGWWAGLDNISVTAKKGGQIILGETFNECTLPDGWSTEILNGVNDWQYGIFTDGRSIDGTCFAYFNDDILGENAPLSKIRMYSPEFSANEFANYQLTYDFIFRFYEASEYLQLYVDNGKEWKTIKTYNGDFGGPNVDAFKKDTIDLSPFRDEKIRLVWEYNDGGWAWWLGLDNVKITAQGNLNDRCSKSIALLADESCIDFDNTNALRDDEFFTTSDNHSGFLYYSFNAPQSASYLIQTKSKFNDIVEVFDGTCTNKDLIKKTNDDEYGFHGEDIYFDAISGQDYIIRLYGSQAEFGLEKGKGCVALKEQQNAIVTPSGDTCKAAIPLEIGIGCTQTKNIKANMDGPTPVSNPRSRADIWFSFIPDSIGDYIFSSNADFADVLAIFKGNCDSLWEVSSNFNGQHISIKNAAVGENYFIQVTGYFSSLVGKLCPVISQNLNPQVENPNCINAKNIEINSACIASSNINAGFSGIQPTCQVYIVDDVWYTFTAPASKEIFLKVKTDFENVVSLYEGNCVDLKSVYCSKDIHHCNGFVHINNLKEGNTYFLQIGAKATQNLSKSGQICVEINDTQPVWDKINLQVTQQCVSKGAVMFIPEATGGTGNFTYAGLGITEPVAGNDQYILEATDEEGCVAFSLIEAVSCNDFGCSLLSVVAKKDVGCYNAADGAVDLQINGGLEPYHVNWANNIEGQKVKNLPAGVYTLTITDGSGCELVENIQIHQPPQIITNPTYKSPLCYSDSTGAISLFVIGGNGQFDYFWSNGKKENSLINIPGGNYSVTITDNAGCVVSETLVLSQPDEISVSGIVVNNTCHGDEVGSIKTEIKGGTLPYSFNWNVGTGSQVDSLKAGIYTITITDKNNCSVEKTWEIKQPDMLQLMVDSIDLSISDTKMGYLSVRMIGGTMPYQYEWYVDDFKLNLQSDHITIQEAGFYHLVVTDANGCVFTSPKWQASNVSSTKEAWPCDLINVNPNPASEILNLSIENPSSIQDLSLLDIAGKRIKSITAYDKNIQVPILDVTPATYLLVWKISNVIYSKKVVVVR